MMSAPEVTNLLLGLLAGLLATMTGAFGWWLSRLSAKIDGLMIHREGCIRQFADRDDNASDHRRLWNAVDEHGRLLHGYGLEIENLKKNAGL